ncbi:MULTISPECIES: toll/interleukin-1 receptor domain-containing protein [Streptomyces]|uniref:toll/interleukin-1 receptor domain-containing protein n=1 Tax=Streptomyces TaxID=1883 RepID=UPI001B35872A|nr:toll/interleukin-1 receptor domain-containing protein [Streptomyces sp. C3-3]
MQAGDDENPPTAFLSHASEDTGEFVEPLARKLAEMGVKPWLDRWDLSPGPPP